MHASLSDSGSLISPKVGLVPAANSAGTRTGAAVDRLGYQSLTMFANVGAATGAPTSFTYNAKLQDSADGSTNWNDVSGAAIAPVIAASTPGAAKVDLATVKRYVRVIEVTAFVGGTTPTLAGAVDLILGGAA